jgi:hypothetical protein
MASSHDRKGQKSIRCGPDVVAKLLKAKHALETQRNEDVSWEATLEYLADHWTIHNKPT